MIWGNILLLLAVSFLVNFSQLMEVQARAYYTLNYYNFNINSLRSRKIFLNQTH